MRVKICAWPDKAYPKWDCTLQNAALKLAAENRYKWRYFFRLGGQREISRHSILKSALHLLEQPAIIINCDGDVLCANEPASKLFDDDFFLRNKRLLAADPRSRIRLELLADQVRILSARPSRTALQAVVHRPQRRPIVIKAVVRGLTNARLMSGVDALLLLTDMDDQPGISQESLIEIFGLTPYQARLASLLVEGKSLKEISRKTQNSSGTARNHLKVVFTQTGTNRQGELVSLLSRLR